MKKFITHPATIIVAIITFFVIGIFIGKSNWLSNLLAKMGGSGNGGGNGSSSTNGNGNNGENGGGLPVDANSIERIAGGNGMSQNETIQRSSAPATILLPVSNLCQTYTTANPYHSQGCSYVFGGYVSRLGIRMCQLKKVSCP